ncbi:GNAT family N-acetyltransferase [Paenibacillus sp. E222]|uniref:GNAT family N-acetyltransferase n=1 Tax=Paenibacillus sp. E222 TaxID=2748863 RepID=UPI0015C67BDE|nr:GNAT family N-acetyltransferase [Paenibacillus sp. E222]QLG41229.1 GNAT family N-acetyltransferase [Paenibacillus sp. E222]
MNPITIEPIDKTNWEEAIAISLLETQVNLVPTVIESLAYAYVKPWDAAFDPYLLRKGDKAFGFFYLSYTPASTDNYWIGGFQIDKNYQGKGLGRKSLYTILESIQDKHPQCQIISLTAEKSNAHARALYEKIGFIDQAFEIQDGEVVYKIKLK